MCLWLQPGRIRLSSEATRNLLACFLWVLKNVERKILNVWLSGASYLKITQLLEAVYLVIANFEYKVSSMDICILIYDQIVDNNYNGLLLL